MCICGYLTSALGMFALMKAQIRMEENRKALDYNKTT
jgi:hypothetical protein